MDHQAQSHRHQVTVQVAVNRRTTIRDRAEHQAWQATVQGASVVVQEHTTA